jgi:sulfite exporter TauE/SafE/copper chaperone CopZ
MPASRRSSQSSATTETFVVPVAGMTCRACERRIERNIRALPDVKRAAASATRGQVIVQVTAPVPDADIAAAIEAAGYSIGRTPWLSRDRGAWLTVGGAVAGLVAVVALATATGLGELAAGAGDIRSGGLVVALLLGLAAGVSTCLALTGGLVLALSAAFEARRDPAVEPGVVARLRPSAVFVAARVVGFTILGMGLGAIGASVTMPPALTAVLMFAVAALMALLGARLTGLSPRVAAWSPTLPSGLARALGIHEGSAATYSDSRAAALGVASFFLPCGFTQAVQVYALSTGSPAIAGAILGVFALGTAPGLLALGGLPAVMPAHLRPTALRVVGVVVVGFALLNGVAGLRLLGVAPDMGAPTVAAAPDVTFEDGVQVLRTYQVANGYQPAEATLYAGVPTRWIVESLEGGSCAIFMQAPALGLQVLLAEGDNVIDLPALEPGRIEYTCSMGMYSAALRVVEGKVGALDGDAGS